MKITKYQGELYYEGDDAYLEISEFIVRGNNIGFSVASVTGEHGRFEAKPDKPAVRRDDGSYLAKGIWAYNNCGTPASSPWDIIFKIKYGDQGNTIEISGELIEDGEIYKFDGKLEAIDN